MYCSKCGKQIRDDSTFCSYCGFEVKPALENSSAECNPKEAASTNEKQRNLPKRKGIIAIAAAAIVLVIVCIAIGTSTKKVKLTEEEQGVYNCAVCLQNMLKDPTSLAIYSCSITYPVDSVYTTVYIEIDYGAKNGYGGMVRNTAIFGDGEYICDYGDTDGSSTQLSEYYDYLSETTDVLTHPENYKKVSIDEDKISTALEEAGLYS